MNYKLIFKYENGEEETIYCDDYVKLGGTLFHIYKDRKFLCERFKYSSVEEVIL